MQLGHVDAIGGRGCAKTFITANMLRHQVCQIQLSLLLRRCAISGKFSASARHELKCSNGRPIVAKVRIPRDGGHDFMLMADSIPLFRDQSRLGKGPLGSVAISIRVMATQGDQTDHPRDAGVQVILECANHHCGHRDHAHD